MSQMRILARWNVFLATQLAAFLHYFSSTLVTDIIDCVWFMRHHGCVVFKIRRAVLACMLRFVFLSLFATRLVLAWVDRVGNLARYCYR